MAHHITVQLKGVSSKDELHDSLAKAFAFPNDHGRNWDVFWDWLTHEGEDITVVTLGGWETFAAKLPRDAAMLLRCLHEWVNQAAVEELPMLCVETSQGRLPLPDTTTEPSYTTLEVKEVRYSGDCLRRAVLAIRDDDNYEVRWEKWVYDGDEESPYSSPDGYWCETGNPSLVDTLERGRLLAEQQGCPHLV